MHVGLVSRPQGKMITPARGSHDHTGGQPAIERLDNKVRLLRGSIPGDHRFDTPAQVIPGRNAGNRFAGFKGHIGYLEHRADDRRDFLWPGELNCAISHVLSFEVLRAFAPFSRHLDPGRFIDREADSLILPVGQG